jgi:phage-related minor tail protein
MADVVLAKMAVEISANAAKFATGINQANAHLKSLSDVASTSNKLLASFGVGFSVAAIISGIRQVIGVAAEFEHTMSEVRGITGATGDEFNKLREDALRLGAATKFTASEVGQLQVAFGRLGFNTKEILAATEATLALAAATGEDLAKSADVAGSTVRGFGLEAEETQRVVDVMAKSFNTTALGLDNFSEAMKYVAPIAKSANVSVEETTALLGVLADAGIRGSSAGTALRKIFGDLSKDGRPVQERLAELGKKGITLSDAFDEVGRTAQTALLVLSENTEKSDRLAKSFQNVTGEAEAMARIMQDDLLGDVDKLSSAFEGFILKLTKTDALRDFTQALTGIVTALSGGSGDILQGLDQLARGVKDGVEATNSGFQIIIDKLKEIRRETGKPIDTRIAQELADKYKLTEEQANVLFEAILDINKALSFQETAIKQFNEFVKRNGYTDLSKAADDYKNRLYELILAEQIRKQKLETSNLNNVFDDQIKGADKVISDYRKVINIINEYTATTEKSEAKVQEVVKATVLNLNFYQEALKKVNTAFEEVALSQGKFGELTEAAASQLRILAAEGAGLEGFIKRVNQLKESFKNFDVVVKAPDTSGLIDPKAFDNTTGKFKEFQNEFGTLTHTATLTEQATERIDASMKKMATTSKESSEEVKKAFIELGSPIGSALSGIGDALGGAIAGTENFGQAILKVVVGFAKQLGEILIATGTAMLAAKKLITNPYTAIIAGIALVALAGAAGAAINKAHSSSFGGSPSRPEASSVQAINRISPSVQRIEVVGELKGEGTSLKATLDAVDRRRQRTG